MKNLFNLVMFTSSQCSGCVTSKHMLSREGYSVEVVDVGSDKGMHLAYEHGIKALPTFLNKDTGETLDGSRPLAQLIELNGGVV